MFLCYFISHEVIPTITCNIMPKTNTCINNDCLSSTFSYLTKNSKPQKNIVSPDIIELEPYLILHYVTENILQLYFAYLNNEILIVFSEKIIYIDIYKKISKKKNITKKYFVNFLDFLITDVVICSKNVQQKLRFYQKYLLNYTSFSKTHRIYSENTN